MSAVERNHCLGRHPQGSVPVVRRRRHTVDRRRRRSSAHRSPTPCATLATVRSMPRSITDTSACTSTAATTGARRGSRSPPRSTRPSRQGEQHVNPMSQKDVEWATQLGWTIEPGHRRRAGRAVVRHDPRRVCSDRTIGATRGSWSMPCGTCRPASKWFGGGYDDAGIHSICVDPRQAPGTRGRHLVRGGVAHRGRRERLGGRRARHAGQLPAARARRRS